MCVFISHGYIPRSRIARPYGYSVFNFWETIKTFFPKWPHHLHSHHQVLSSSFSIPSLILAILFFLYYSHLKKKEVYLLNNVVLVSGIQQCEYMNTYIYCKAAICIHIFLPSWASRPYSHPAPLSHHRAPSWAPCAI